MLARLIAIQDGCYRIFLHDSIFSSMNSSCNQVVNNLFVYDRTTNTFHRWIPQGQSE